MYTYGCATPLRSQLRRRPRFLAWSLWQSRRVREPYRAWGVSESLRAWLLLTPPSLLCHPQSLDHHDHTQHNAPLLRPQCQPLRPCTLSPMTTTTLATTTTLSRAARCHPIDNHDHFHEYVLPHNSSCNHFHDIVVVCSLNAAGVCFARAHSCHNPVHEHKTAARIVFLPGYISRR